MRIIATLPPPQNKLFKHIATHPLVGEVRFNVGMRTPFSPEETIRRVVDVAKNKKVWLDIKGRQLRITQWAVPTYGDIILNHKIKVPLPATIWFRGNEKSNIVASVGDKLYVDPAPMKAVGAGQAVNIHSIGKIQYDEYLTDEDKEYLTAAKKLNINNLMLSFVEEWDDVLSATNICPAEHVIGKIESFNGMKYINTLKNISLESPFHLMAARDDLYINTPEPKYQILDYLKEIINIDKQAVLASRVLESFLSGDNPSLGDIADVELMFNIGYRNFMFGDSICQNEKAFNKAVEFLVGYVKWRK